MANQIAITGEDVMNVRHMTSDELVVELAHTRILMVNAKTQLLKRLTQAAEHFLECEFQRRGWNIRDDWALAGPRSAELCIQLMHVCRYVASEGRYDNSVRNQASMLREALRKQFIAYMVDCLNRNGSMQELDRAFWWDASREAEELVASAYRHGKPTLADWLKEQVKLLTTPVADLTLDSGTE